MINAEPGPAIETTTCPHTSLHASTQAADDLQAGVLRVRLWFGPHEIADYIAEATLAERYAASIRRRFAGLHVTVEDLPESTAPPAAAAGSTSSSQVQTTSPSMTPLPSELLWELTP